VTVNLDKTAPSTQIAVPADGAEYLLNQPVSADFSCADGLSGVATCTGTAAHGAAVDTATAGTRHFTIEASDVADNGGNRTVAYAVRYDFLGFPTSAVPANPGRTIPVKWRLFDAGRSPIARPGAVLSLASSPVACAAPAAAGPAEPATGDLQVDAATGFYRFLWRTERVWEGCRVLELRLDDGSTHRATFDFTIKRKGAKK
jgi:hypothetical protein